MKQQKSNTKKLPNRINTTHMKPNSENITSKHMTISLEAFSSLFTEIGSYVLINKMYGHFWLNWTFFKKIYHKTYENYLKNCVSHTHTHHNFGLNWTLSYKKYHKTCENYPKIKKNTYKTHTHTHICTHTHTY